MSDLTIIPAGEKLMAVSDEEILSIEESVGEKLPDNYKRFLTKYGASAFDGYASILADDGENLAFNYFYGSEHDLLGVLEVFSDCLGFLPPSHLPIADDSFGNIFCLNLVNTKNP